MVKNLKMDYFEYTNGGNLSGLCETPQCQGEKKQHDDCIFNAVYNPPRPNQ